MPAVSVLLRLLFCVNVREVLGVTAVLITLQEPAVRVLLTGPSAEFLAFLSLFSVLWKKISKK